MGLVEQFSWKTWVHMSLRPRQDREGSRGMTVSNSILVNQWIYWVTYGIVGDSGKLPHQKAHPRINDDVQKLSPWSSLPKPAGSFTSFLSPSTVITYIPIEEGPFEPHTIYNLVNFTYFLGLKCPPLCWLVLRQWDTQSRIIWKERPSGEKMLP